MEEPMSERRDSLKTYVSDMLAVERHMLPAFENQSADRRLDKFPEAQRLVRAIKSTIQTHIDSLEQHLQGLGNDASSPIKSAVTAALGMAASLIENMRTDPVSKNLRDDYTVLNLAAISYTMLHTTGSALQSEETAELALRHLKDYTPLLTRINALVPQVVVNELADETEILDISAAERAVARTQEAWTHDHLQSATP
jgi:ferritin-like metal-binding protein YciE